MWLPRVSQPNGLHRVDWSNSPDPTGPRSPLCLTCRGAAEQTEGADVRVPLKEPQSYVFICGKRFRILVAGRRFGKAFLALVELIRAAWGPGRIVWYVAPTYKQAKHIAWKMLKRLTQPYWAGKPNETDLSIELTCGGVIALRGADNYASLRGEGLDFIVLDENA